MTVDVIVVGGGAAGFFGAIQLKELRPDLQVLIVEKSPKLLSKVRISGGGRCNVTHDCFEPTTLASHYPRGEKALRTLFKSYQAGDVIKWFERKGVDLKVEDDGRMFPVTDDSQTVIDCFMKEVHAGGTKIIVGNGLTTLRKNDSGFTAQLSNGDEVQAHCVLAASGGNASITSYQWIAQLGLKIIPPRPSLFTFNDPSKRFADLMGVSVSNGFVRIAGTKLSGSGPILITHWGLSGPCVIKLSAWAAEYLHDCGYDFIALVSWVGDIAEDAMRQKLLEQKQQKVKQKVLKNPLFELPLRLWERLCEQSAIDEGKVWGEMPLKNINKLLENLIRCPIAIKGKTTFKEEFVTCGGVDLSEVDLRTMQSRKIPGLYFAGEVLNIDGETGGFNFQSAWTTAYVAAKAIALNSPPSNGGFPRLTTAPILI
jgi:predicted Rossmann fold flavoprotein